MCLRQSLRRSCVRAGSSCHPYLAQSPRPRPAEPAYDAWRPGKLSTLRVRAGDAAARVSIRALACDLAFHRNRQGFEFPLLRELIKASQASLVAYSTIHRSIERLLITFHLFVAAVACLYASRSSRPCSPALLQTVVAAVPCCWPVAASHYLAPRHPTSPRLPSRSAAVATPRRAVPVLSPSTITTPGAVVSSASVEHPSQSSPTAPPAMEEPAIHPSVTCTY